MADKKEFLVKFLRKNAPAGNTKPVANKNKNVFSAKGKRDKAMLDEFNKRMEAAFPDYNDDNDDDVDSVVESDVDSVVEDDFIPYSTLQRNNSSFWRPWVSASGRCMIWSSLIPDNHINNHIKND
ncbi:hypothetical protein FCL47_23545 [Desulfopila sp. IMCC35006]|uniref:hypothetical protein n=1 Tax=Desulfopila sp. IMCC35006 TaxID=2569542 RepID=UPI0010AD86CF|nr:hypothetical protein [Desulfopila sp. IMCC35006]TKB23190.1 hypothetical protein FCL47_23545 [Desulfopila sp. IMCC35006]